MSGPDPEALVLVGACDLGDGVSAPGPGAGSSGDAPSCASAARRSSIRARHTSWWLVLMRSHPAQPGVAPNRLTIPLVRHVRRCIVSGPRVALASTSTLGLLIAISPCTDGDGCQGTPFRVIAASVHQLSSLRRTSRHLLTVPSERKATRYSPERLSTPRNMSCFHRDSCLAKRPASPHARANWDIGLLLGYWASRGKPRRMPSGNGATSSRAIAGQRCDRRPLPMWKWLWAHAACLTIQHVKGAL